MLVEIQYKNKDIIFIEAQQVRLESTSEKIKSLYTTDLKIIIKDTVTNKDVSWGTYPERNKTDLTNISTIKIDNNIIFNSDTFNPVNMR